MTMFYNDNFLNIDM